MNDPFQFFWTLVQFKAAVLVMVAVLVLGVMLKAYPKFDNQKIPWVVVAAATLIYLILCEPPKDAFNGVRATASYLLTTLIIGSFWGLLAWLSHASLLKKFEQSIPFLGDKLSQSNQNQNKQP